MINILLVIIAGLIPVIYYLSAHYFARRNGTQKHLDLHFPTRVADWLFIPFNISAVLSVSLQPGNFLIVLIICIIPALLANKVWKDNSKGSSSVFFINNKLHSVGWVHTIFFLIELPLVCLFLVLPSLNLWYVVGTISLLTYLILCIRNQLINPTLAGQKKPEIPIHSICIIILLSRMILALLDIY